jgi:hypothetical protein
MSALGHERRFRDVGDGYFKRHPERLRGGRQFSITRDCASHGDWVAPARRYPSVESNFVEARTTLFSELLDIVLVREGNSDQPPAAVVQTFEQKYGLRKNGLRKSGRSSDSGFLDLPSGLIPHGSVAALRATAGSGS